MDDRIEVGEDLIEVQKEIQLLIKDYEESLKNFNEGMEGFLDGGNGYLGSTKENLDNYHKGFGAQLGKLINYLTISSSFIDSIYVKFNFKDEELSKIMNTSMGDSK